MRAVCCILALYIRHAKRFVSTEHYTYWHLWPAWLHHIFPQYLINGTICRKDILDIEYVRVCVIFYTGLF